METCKKIGNFHAKLSNGARPRGSIAFKIEVHPIAGHSRPDESRNV